MRILISTGIGFAVGLVFVVQLFGFASLIPVGIFRTIITPAIIVAETLSRRSGGWSIIPYTIVAQWTIIGAVVGLISKLGNGQNR